MIAPGERASPTLELPPVAPSDAYAASRGVGPAAPPLPGPTGQQLLEEFIRFGRQRPFEEITRRYAGMVFNVCLRVTKDKHDAEDATQAVFLTLAVQAKRGADIKALGPWLQQVAKRLSLDVRRGKKRRKTREERHQDEQERRRSNTDGDGLPAADLDELKTILHEELQKLPAKYRLPLVLHYFGGMTREEMAAELKVKPSTLGVRIFRGREMLAGRLNGRGVHLPAGALALAIGYLVKRAVTDAALGSMVARTSHAATALAWGADFHAVGDLMAAHDGGQGAARVLAIARRASHVLTIGKVRVTVAVALIVAATSTGAGVKAFALLPPITARQVRQLLSDSVDRLVGPLLSQPVSLPTLRAQAPTPTPAAPVAVVPVPVDVVRSSPAVAAPAWSGPAVAVAPTAVPTLPATATPAIGSVPPVVLRPDSVGVTAGPARAMPSPVGVSAAPPAESTATADASAHRATDPTIVRANPVPLIASSGSSAPMPSGNESSASSPVLAGVMGGAAATAAAAQDLYVPATAAGPRVAAASAAVSITMLATPASQVQILQVPAVGGSVTESNGVVRGYGLIDRSGTLTVSGKVVADGDGHDRTLDLTRFSAVREAAASTPTATPAASGFYAADHGRLSLPLTPAPSATSGVMATAGVPVASAAAVVDAVGESTPRTATLTWGADPSAVTLTPVNSVRLTVDASTAAPTALSLLAADRSDAPPVPSADGAVVGLWQVGAPSAASAPLSAVDIVVRYDDHLVDELGGDESGVRLYTLASAADADGGWVPVDAGSLSVDTADHLVSGSATDVGYFAVTVPPAADVTDAATLIAHPAAIVVPTAGGAASNVVPEPTALAAAALAAAGLLGRRRRRTAETTWA